jgi:hypothetical protein
MNEPLELLWREIEAAPRHQETGWIRRLANPAADVPVYAAVANRDGTRSLMIDIPHSVLGRLQGLPRTSGLSMRLVPPLEGLPSELRSFAVELEDAQFSDLFTIFCTDLLEGISHCTKAAEAVILLLRRLERWQELLSIASNALSQSAIVGLFGELSFLRDVLIPFGGSWMIESWTGSQRAPQDFVVPEACAIEVKTSAAKVQSHVQIHGEQQLDASGVRSLFLGCFRVELDSEDGESLNDVIDQLRVTAARTQESALLFARLLTNAGYLDRHRPRYESLLYKVAQRRYFRVENQFPRLLTDNVPVGIDDVNYRLELKACSAFECDQSALVAALARTNQGSTAS